MIDKQTIDDVHILYICSYGQTELPVCVDLEHRYCKLKSRKSKKCNLRPVVSYKDYKRKEQECEELKAEIKLSKEMLIQNTSETNKYTMPQIIEQFISDNYIDQQTEDGYTIPVFIQIKNIFDIKENLEQQVDQLKAENEKLKAEKVKYYQQTLDDEIQINELLQTLTEIKEIVEPFCDACQEFEPQKSKNCINCTYCNYNEILQKISENEVNNAR